MLVECVTVCARMCVCVSISVMGGNIGFKDIGEDSFIHHCCSRRGFQSSIGADFFATFVFDFTF